MIVERGGFLPILSGLRCDMKDEEDRGRNLLPF